MVVSYGAASEHAHARYHAQANQAPQNQLSMEIARGVS